MRFPGAVLCAAACATVSVVPIIGRAAEASPGASQEAKPAAKQEAKQVAKPAAKPAAKPDQDQLEALRRQVEELTLRLDAATAVLQAEHPAPSTPPEAQPGLVAQAGKSSDSSAAGEAPAQPAPAKPKKLLNFYGYLDLSVDYATKGLQGRVPNDPTVSPPVGHMGWLPAISSNSSYLGVRGGLELGTPSLSAVYQLEAQVDVAATPGYANGNYFGDSRVVGALASRNSYVGLAGPSWGALKAGKSDTPYYMATRRMDPFYGTVGTMTSIMGNTGGDNRVEFGYRMSHALWYESPKMEGLSFSALVSPGQNRNEDNLIQPQGEPNCTGYYVPGIVNPLCNDGAFGTGWSAALTYDRGSLYALAAWELHENANRTVDELANGGASPDGSIGIANEYAWKLGAEFKFPTNTTVGAIYERLRRANPGTQDFNERDRFGTWLEVVQKVTSLDEVYAGWAHAGNTPGDVGTKRRDGSTDVGPVDNKSDMFSLGFKHRFHADGQPTLYAVYALQSNSGSGAHYDLGAGSHGIPYDCHDAGADAPNSINNLGPQSPTNPNSGNVPFPFGGGRCFAGGTLQAASIGMTYSF
jgi:predicted porin